MSFDSYILSAFHLTMGAYVFMRGQQEAKHEKIGSDTCSARSHWGIRSLLQDVHFTAQQCPKQRIGNE